MAKTKPTKSTKTPRQATNLFMSCAGNGFVHPPTVFPQKCKARNGSLYWTCAICGLRSFGIARNFARVGYTRDQIRAMCPGAIDGNGMVI